MNLMPGTLAAVKRLRKEATDRIVEGVNRGQGQAVSFVGMDRQYFASKPGLSKRWAKGAAKRGANQEHQNFARRTLLKASRVQEQEARRKAGQRPWKPEPPRPGHMQPRHLRAAGPTVRTVRPEAARPPPLTVYSAFLAWTELPPLTGGPGCRILPVDDHGRGMRGADLIVMGSMSDMESSRSIVVWALRVLACSSLF